MSIAQTTDGIFTINRKTSRTYTSEFDKQPSELPDDYKILLPLLEVNLDNVDYYVIIAVYLKINKSWICGFINRNEEIKYPVDVEHNAYEIPYADLHPMRELL